MMPCRAVHPATNNYSAATLCSFSLARSDGGRMTMWKHRGKSRELFVPLFILSAYVFINCNRLLEVNDPVLPFGQ